MCGPQYAPGLPIDGSLLLYAILLTHFFLSDAAAVTSLRALLLHLSSSLICSPPPSFPLYISHSPQMLFFSTFIPSSFIFPSLNVLLYFIISCFFLSCIFYFFFIFLSQHISFHFLVFFCNFSFFPFNRTSFHYFFLQFILYSTPLPLTTDREASIWAEIVCSGCVLESFQR